MPEEVSPRELWYTQKSYFSPYLQQDFKVKKKLHKEKTPYQTIEVIDTYEFGRMLILDGVVMVTERDEFAYHEMLVHPAMIVHPNPKRIAVIGGGDGGTVREILKYEVDEIKLIEIDKRVIDVSNEYFPELTKGLKDWRVEIINTDGALWVKKEKGKFDIIFVDSTDPIGPGARLVEDDFLNVGANLLNSDGIWVAQTETPFYITDFVKSYNKKLKKLFKIVRVYLAEVPSYGGVWSFTFASQKIDPLSPKRTPPAGLKYYNPDIHIASFALPQYLKEIASSR
ncbi:MAG: polyamine aminopropyltransferase [bacterium]|nr:polyamine aminopropyltransferase [bacterium]